MQATIKELLEKEFGLKYEDMELLKTYNVEEANIAVKAYNEEKQQVEYAKVIAAIKKPYDATEPAVQIKLAGSEGFEEPVSARHLYATWVDENNRTTYTFAKDIKPHMKVFTLSGYKEVVDTWTCEGEDWLDIQTTLENYFTGEVLSHNSPMAHLNALTGGYAVNFYPSTRFRVTAKEPLLRNGEIVGIKIKIKNYKNKTGIPNRECFLDVYFHDGEDYKAGIDGEGQYLDMLLELGLIKQHGAWYYYREDDPDPNKLVKCQGWGGVQNWFKENPDEFAKVKELVNAKMSGFDETLDKNSVETSELEEIKKEISEKQEQLKENTEMLAEQALAASETTSEEDPVA